MEAAGKVDDTAKVLCKFCKILGSRTNAGLALSSLSTGKDKISCPGNDPRPFTVQHKVPPTGKTLYLTKEKSILTPVSPSMYKK